MGAYLSQPKTDKVSTDESNNYLSVGASSMQGWRNSQEDAHNSILNFDKNTAFFAVYDGHGGAEVSTYCADKLPQFLKALAAYLDGNFEKALTEAFLGFDKTLLDPEVIETLKILAGEKNFVDGDDSDAMEDDEDENLAELHEEGNLPLDEVMEKYKGHPSMPSLKKLKDSNSSKPQSPFLRGRRAAAVIADAANRAELDPESKPEGSSTSKAALAALNDDGPSSSKSSPSGTKMETEEDSTVSSSSSSASKSNSNNNSAKNAAEAEASTTVEVAETAINGQTTDAVVPDSSASKENEQNGSVSSSEVKKKDVPTTSSSKEDAIVSGSSDANKKELKQNGSVESSTKSPAKQEANSSTITSTSKSKKNAKIEEDDEDVDFDANESNARQALEYSSEDEEELGEDDTTDEDADYDDDEVEEDDEEVEDEEDEESYLANEQFCANMIEEPGKDSGCTAVVGLLNGRDLYVANAGDSRCVVCRKGKAIEMSLDHKPEDDEESSRIIKAGGRVTLDGRVNGGLNLSRALGDHAYKMNHDLPAEEQMISALPDIKKLIISPDDEFMVLACDGIWNFMTSEEVVDFVRLRINDENKKMSEICEELFEACLAPNTLGDGTGCDNMTAVIVRFKPSILELPTKLNPNDAEDVLLAKQEADAEKSGQKAQKRAASPTSDDNDSNEAENKNKRLKTDGDVEENKTSSSSSPKTKSSSSSSMPANSTDAASSNESSTTSAAKEVQKDCDSAVASST
ncbi:probable protein phosphatase CG10417 [Calliphora vicina]|uniref:probable protein phosphatase CG10417 n=1 Tax=Calliphora vicina TaxID=7373 RepID=UPI00325B122F